MKRCWLKDWPWETVVVINAGLCKEKNALHKPTSDGYKPAQKLWESSRTRELTLRETFDICRQCHKLAKSTSPRPSPQRGEGEIPSWR